jgi:hypothetical protein
MFYREKEIKNVDIERERDRHAVIGEGVLEKISSGTFCLIRWPPMKHHRSVLRSHQLAGQFLFYLTLFLILGGFSSPEDLLDSIP